jgi:hypothetical protein
MNFGAKRAKLVQLMHKFVQPSRVGIFWNNARDPCHWTLKSCFGAFRTVPLQHELWWKTDQSGVINALEPPYWPPTHVLGHFRPFLWSTNFCANRAELGSLMHKFVQRCRVGFFHNKCIRPTPLDPKLMFWGVLDRSIFGWTLVQNRANRWN